MAHGFHVTIDARDYQRDAVDTACASPTGGILCLPCGAGKTIIALMLAARRGGHALIFCNTVEVADQVVRALQEQTDLPDECILRLTATHKMRPERLHDRPVVMVTTYAMMYGERSRTAATRACMNAIMRHKWRTVLLDEVHCAAASASAACWTRIAADARFGLTATLVRADDGIDDLLRDVGPVLYELSWRSLEDAGFTARVKPVVIVCECPRNWAQLAGRVRSLADVMNPSKVDVCDVIIKTHTSLGEKVIVFCDKLWTCRQLAIRYTCPFLTGDTPDYERADMLAAFRAGTYRTIVLSRVGDTGWDLDASVGVVVDAHFGSKRQQAQRCGRIMRPNPGDRLHLLRSRDEVR